MDNFIDVNFEIPYRLIIDKGNMKIKYSAVFIKNDTDGAEIRFVKIMNVDDGNSGNEFIYEWANVEDIIAAINEAIEKRYNIVWNGNTKIIFE